MSYQIRVSTKETTAPKRKADIGEDEDAENGIVGKIGIRNSSYPPAPKSLRIIDLAYQSQSDPLAITLNDLSLVSERTSKWEADTHDKSKDASAVDDTFLYDLYAVSTNFDEDIPDDLGDEPPLEGIYEGDSDEFDEKHLYDGEDSDSNSESNWRNDYPDEEDLESSDKHSRDSDLDDNSARVLTHAIIMISLKTLFLLIVCVCLAVSQDAEEEVANDETKEAGDTGNATVDVLNGSETLAAEDSVCELRVSTPLIVGSLILYKLLA
ncbi:unnamed protein product [Hydatigera taeniaeformis]|uniref:RNA polymerase II nuclear localization protein SLC7A6OS n=1 Tax=Hydatigena taeniaeformis TaxID=6205 RepID=A0A3P7ENT1_HYDTA|nr:unnamed protein product [Hydatigera taeniaeformis]